MRFALLNQRFVFTLSLTAMGFCTLGCQRPAPVTYVGDSRQPTLMQRVQELEHRLKAQESLAHKQQEEQARLMQQQREEFELRLRMQEKRSQAQLEQVQTQLTMAILDLTARSVLRAELEKIKQIEPPLRAILKP